MRKDIGKGITRNAYVVGENGPEIFVPDRSGKIVPNPATRLRLAGRRELGGPVDPIRPIGAGTATVDGQSVDYQDIGVKGKDPLLATYDPSRGSDGQTSTPPPIGGVSGDQTTALPSTSAALASVPPIGGATDKGTGGATTGGTDIDLATVPPISASALPANDTPVDAFSQAAKGGLATAPDVPPIGMTTTSGTPYNPVKDATGPLTGAMASMRDPADAVRAKFGFLPTDYYQNPAKYQDMLAGSAVDLTGQAHLLTAQDTGEYQRGLIPIEALKAQGVAALTAAETNKALADATQANAHAKYFNLKADPNSPLYEGNENNTAEIKNLEYYSKVLGIPKKDLANHVLQGKIQPSELAARIYTDMKKNALPDADGNLPSDDELAERAKSTAQKFYDWGASQGGVGAGLPVARDISSLRKKFAGTSSGLNIPLIGQVGGTDYEYLVGSALQNGWTPDEILRAAQGTPGEKAVAKLVANIQNVPPIGSTGAGSAQPTSSSYPPPGPITAAVGKRPPLSSFMRMSPAGKPPTTAEEYLAKKFQR